MYDNLKLVTSGFEEKAKKRACGSSAWIFKVKRDTDSELLTKLDSIVANMPKDEEAKLNKRFLNIIPDSARKYVREYDDQFLEAFVEILGWGWLKERYSRYNPKFTMGTPDLAVEDDSGKPFAAMECKKIRASDKDRKYYESQLGKVKRVNDNLNPFRQKIEDTLSKAEQQVSQSQASNRFLFVNFSFDTEYMFDDILCNKTQIVKLIQRLESKLCKKGILLIAFEQFQVDKPITSAGLL